MFWGTKISQGKPYKLTKDDLSKVVRVTHASLGINPKKGI